MADKLQQFPVVYKVYNVITTAVTQEIGRGTSKMVSIKTAQRGLHDGWTRATFILRERHLEKLKALAHWERKTIKEVVDEALGSYLKRKRVAKKG